MDQHSSLSSLLTENLTSAPFCSFENTFPFPCRFSKYLHNLPNAATQHQLAFLEAADQLQTQLPGSTSPGSARTILYLGTCTLKPSPRVPCQTWDSAAWTAFLLHCAGRGSACLQMASFFYSLKLFSLLHRLHPKKPGGHFCSRATSTQAATTF